MDWVRFFGISLHVWRKETLHKLGELIGMVEEIDDRCLEMEVVEFVRMRLAHRIDLEIPRTFWLDVGDVQFHIWTEVELKLMVPMEEISCWRDRSDPVLFLTTTTV